MVQEHAGASKNQHSCIHSPVYVDNKGYPVAMVGIKNQKRIVEKVNACLVQAALLLMTSKGLFSHVFPILSWLCSLLVAGFWLGRSPVAISCPCTDCHSCSRFLPKAHHVLLCFKRYNKLCCSLIRSLNHLFSVFLRCKCHKLLCKGNCLSYTLG